MSSGAACAPRMIIAGSPGESCISVKTMSDTPMSTGISISRRLPINLSMVSNLPYVMRGYVGLPPLRVQTRRAQPLQKQE